MSNLNVLDKMLQEKRTLHIEKIDGDIEVRDLPFTTFSHILLALFETKHEEKENIRNKILTALVQITESKEGIPADELQNTLNFATPIIIRVVMKTPELINRFLQDVVVGVTQEHIDVMPSEMVTAIVADSIDHVDLSIISEHIKRVFSQAATVWKTLPTSGQKAEQVEEQLQEKN